MLFPDTIVLYLHQPFSGITVVDGGTRDWLAYLLVSTLLVALGFFLFFTPLPVYVADDGIMYGSRHNYNGGGANQLCIKNAAGDQGGVRQGSQDSNDMVVPVRRDHANYNNLPSRSNILRARDNWVVPCAKCKYAKSCFMESAVPECPSGYHKMYTGYLFGGHEGNHGNNNRVCIDRNPADQDCEATGPLTLAWPQPLSLGLILSPGFLSLPPRRLPERVVEVG